MCKILSPDVAPFSTIWGLDSEDFDFLPFWEFLDRLPFPNLSIKIQSLNAFISKPHPSRKLRKHKTLLGSTPSRPVSSARHQIIKNMLTQKVLNVVLVCRCQPKGHGSRPGFVQGQVAKNLGLGVRVATRFAQSRSQIILGGQLLMPFATIEVLSGLYLRGPNPKLQKSCDPLCAKQVADFPEALIFPRDPLCSACLPLISKICGKSLGAKQFAGFLEAMDCGCDPLCRDHFLYKLKTGCNPFAAKQVA